MKAEGAKIIRHKVRKAVRLERSLWIQRALFAFAAYVSVFAAIHFALDWALRPGTPGRLVLAGVFVAAVAAAARREIWQRLRGLPSHDDVALEIERFFPFFQGRFVSSWQLLRAAGGGSPRLVERLIEETAHVSRPLNVRSVPDRRGRNRALAAALLFAAGWIGFVAFTPTGRASFPVWIARLLHPLDDIEYPTKTLVIVEKGDRLIARGDDVELRARAAGIIPADGSIFIRRGTGRWIEHPVVGSGRNFVFTQKAAVESFDYYWRLGDGRSPIYHVKVVIPPQVRAIEVLYEYPPYTHRAPRTALGGNLEALPGTLAHLSIRTNKAIRKGAVVLDDGKRIALSRVGATTYTVTIPIAKRGSYKIRLVDRYGFANRDPMEYAIRLSPDEPPRVELVDIEARKFVTPYAVLPLKIRCRDDYGLRRVQVHVRVAGKKETAVEVPIRPNRRELTVEKTLELEKFGLKPGMEATLWASATDNCAIGEPNRGLSQKVRLEVVGPEELMQLLRERMESLIPKLERIGQESLESKTTVEDMIPRVEKSDRPTTPGR